MHALRGARDPLLIVVFLSSVLRCDPVWGSSSHGARVSESLPTGLGPDSFKLSFGKYSGKRLGEVAAQDPAYVRWLVQAKCYKNRPELFAALAHHGALGEQERAASSKPGLPVSYPPEEKSSVATSKSQPGFWPSSSATGVEGRLLQEGYAPSDVSISAGDAAQSSTARTDGDIVRDRLLMLDVPFELKRAASPSRWPSPSRRKACSPMPQAASHTSAAAPTDSNEVTIAGRPPPLRTDEEEAEVGVLPPSLSGVGMVSGLGLTSEAVLPPSLSGVGMDWEGGGGGGQDGSAAGTPTSRVGGSVLGEARGSGLSLDRAESVPDSDGVGGRNDGMEQVESESEDGWGVTQDDATLTDDRVVHAKDGTIHGDEPGVDGARDETEGELSKGGCKSFEDSAGGALGESPSRARALSEQCTDDRI